MTRLAVFATHPIQYQVSWFQRLAREAGLLVRVFYGMLPDDQQQGVGFGERFQWDIPLLGGYEWEVLENLASSPSLDRFGGCRVRGLGKRLRDWRPDVALITGWHSLYLMQALLFCKWLRVPILVRGDSNVFAPRPGWKRLGHRMLFRLYDGFLAVGKANRQLYIASGIAENRIFFCPHFVDNECFARRAGEFRQERYVLRRRWGIPKDAFCFLFAGKLTPKKRIQDFLRALSIAGRDHTRAYGVVVGAGEGMETARILADKERIPVSFVGFLNQSDMPSAYAVADCLVLPSDEGETWGLVVNEAMACGLPAIVSDRVGCGPDLLAEGQTGASYPCGDVSRLAQLMGKGCSVPEEMMRMGERAKALVKDEFCVERAVQGLLEALRATVVVDSTSIGCVTK